MANTPCPNFTMTCAHWAAQVVFTLAMMFFFMFMIAFRDGPLEVYLPLLTSAASLWMPSPGIPKRKVPGLTASASTASIESGGSTTAVTT
jgi:hypothetical protein